MNPDTASFRTAELRALRATIQRRGSLRIGLAFGTVLGWSLTSAATALPGPALPGFAGLLVLAAGFEAVFALHIGAERIGRYVQVAYEERLGVAGWESSIMAHGRRFRGGGSDPLFGWIFGAATLLNLVLTLSGSGWGPMGAAACLLHAGFAARLVAARRFAAGQRDRDLAAFRQLLVDSAPDPGSGP